MPLKQECSSLALKAQYNVKILIYSWVKLDFAQIS